MIEIQANDPQPALSALLSDPDGAYQRWQRQEAPYHEMCRAVVLAYCGRNPEPASLAGNAKAPRTV